MAYNTCRVTLQVIWDGAQNGLLRLILRSASTTVILIDFASLN